MDLESLREKVANELWEGADLPEPLNKEGERTQWVKYKKQTNVWVRCFRGKTRNEIFRIKWKSNSIEFVSAGLM